MAGGSRSYWSKVFDIVLCCPYSYRPMNASASYACSLRWASPRTVCCSWPNPISEGDRARITNGRFQNSLKPSTNKSSLSQGCIFPQKKCWNTIRVMNCHELLIGSRMNEWGSGSLFLFWAEQRTRHFSILSGFAKYPEHDISAFKCSKMVGYVNRK